MGRLDPALRAGSGLQIFTLTVAVMGDLPMATAKCLGKTHSAGASATLQCIPMEAAKCL